MLLFRCTEFWIEKDTIIYYVYEDETIELVLMDIMMPEMDGYEAIRKLRSQEAFKALPIIALTARAKKTDREDCISAGANDYLSKPIKIDTLKKMLTKYLPPIQPEHESI